MNAPTPIAGQGKGAPLVSILIVNFNAGERLAKCMAHLARQSVSNFEIIIIDNGSTDDSLQSVRPDDHIRVLRAGENLGFAAANNLGAREAHGQWLALLNPDAYPNEDWLERMLEAARQFPQFSAFGSLQLIHDDPARIDGAGDALHALGVAFRGHYGERREHAPPSGEAFAPCAAAALYRRDVFLALGGFDEFFFCYGEDVDFGFRLRLAGGAAMQVHDAIVRHEGSGISGKTSEFTVYHGNRNRIWLVAKSMPAILFWTLAPVRLALDLYLLARWTSLGQGGVYARALRDGYGGAMRVRNAARPARRARRATLIDIVRIMTWSPLALSTRRAKILPIKKQAREEPAFNSNG